MLHVVPPQSAPEYIKQSGLASDNGWLDVHHKTLRHNQYHNIYGLGDIINTPNAKTAAAVRKQVPVVAHNLINDMLNKSERALYNGYGSCPLTVERGKIVLAEFGYGGQILNTFPEWLFNGKEPTKIAWFLKEKILPPLYWYGMLKGHELLVSPEYSEDSDI
jgi:sulfide:quinone oxidoreductase